MARIDEIIEILNRIAPFELCCEWDNCGVIVNSGRDIDKVMLCLDVTLDVVKEAKKVGAQLIISHHPVIFKPLKNIDFHSPVYLLCKEEISCIAMHTNLDAAEGGVNDMLAGMLGITDCTIFEEVGRIGELSSPTSTLDLTTRIASELKCQPRYYDAGSPISRIAVLGGAGSYVDKACKCSADCYITGELRHDDWLMAKQLSISVIEAGHFATERPIISVLCDRLCLEFGSSIEFVVSQIEAEPSTLFC